MTPIEDRVSADDRSADLRQEIEPLRDLFVRRLYDDKTKNRMVEVLDEQLRASQALLDSRALESFILECLLVVDRLVEGTGRDADLHLSAADELLEVFRRRGLTVVPVEHGFDPRLHLVVDTVPAVSADQVNTIVHVHRDGYSLGERLLRPAKVTLAVASPGDSALSRNRLPT